ncbi:MAG TPA: PilZ domain-containing protein [Bryobacteraceae bacterium]|nr:PilZ domain-containing protein [Bryobacteraceae bacterium]
MSHEEKAQESISGDRRVDTRYQLHLELKWKLIRRRKIQDTGVGHTIDLSSGGILFDATRPLPEGLNVELSIAWPVLLHNVAPMQLVVCGRLVRSNGAYAAVRITQHEFRTAGIPAEHRQVLANAARTPLFLVNTAFSDFDKLQ